jgi:hypothetical protein
MATNVLVLGLDSRDPQLERLRGLGYHVDGLLVDPGDASEALTKLHLESRTFDCVLFDAALRAPANLLLLEKLLNLVHARAPHACICFNTTSADSAEAVQRWV